MASRVGGFYDYAHEVVLKVFSSKENAENFIKIRKQFLQECLFTYQQLHELYRDFKRSTLEYSLAVQMYNTNKNSLVEKSNLPEYEKNFLLSSPSCPNEPWTDYRISEAEED